MSHMNSFASSYNYNWTPNVHFNNHMLRNEIPETISQNKVYINPNFSKKSQSIHVNPRLASVCDTKFLNTQICPPTNTSIHVNPNMRLMQIPKTVHINPNFKRIEPTVPELQPIAAPITEKLKLNKPVLLTRTKLIRNNIVDSVKKPKRNSVKSKFKIVRSNCQPVNCKDKISRFKVDHRQKKTITPIKKRYSFLNLTNKVKNSVIKTPIKRNLSIININGVKYQNSRNSLKITASTSSVSRKLVSPTTKSKYKLFKKQNLEPSKLRLSPVKKYIFSTHSILKKPRTPRKLKICNIPCLYYKKYGICKKKQLGKCSKKHDPDQVALCTRFLQGACVKPNCLLSHKVSPEKMPTCKFYLEGSCTKEDCPYLHVKLSQNAEICRDFLEGFCRNAAQCNKRHQYLCPEYEKLGNCPKQRCAYPHGQLVRSYLINKTKFVKNYSAKSKSKKSKPQTQKEPDKTEERQRYYKKDDAANLVNESDERKSRNENFVSLKSRPKLGSLPAFIPFTD